MTSKGHDRDKFMARSERHASAATSSSADQVKIMTRSKRHASASAASSSSADQVGEVVGFLGRGQFGSVVLSRVLGLEFATKVMPNCPLAEHEAQILSELRHPNIVTYYGHWVSDDDKMNIRTAYHGRRTLLSETQKNGPLDENQARRVMRDVLSALDYAHREKGIIHRDVKAENVVLKDDESAAFLCDWGLAKRWSKGEKIFELAGSLHYCPPEAFLNQGYYGPEFDVWSAGVLLYVITHGVFPFPGKTKDEISRNVCALRFDVSPSLSQPLADLIRAILVPADARPTIADVMQSAWMSASQLRELSAAPFASHNMDLYRQLIREDKQVESSLKSLVEPLSVEAPPLPRKKLSLRQKFKLFKKRKSTPLAVPAQAAVETAAGDSPPPSPGAPTIDYIHTRGDIAFTCALSQPPMSLKRAAVSPRIDLKDNHLAFSEPLMRTRATSSTPLSSANDWLQGS